MTDAERFEVTRTIDTPPSKVFSLLCDPRGHVTTDSSGMLEVRRHGDHHPVRAGRPSGGTISGRIGPPIKHLQGYRLAVAEDRGTLVTSYYDWREIEEQYRDKGILPVIRRGLTRHARDPGS